MAPSPESRPARRIRPVPAAAAKFFKANFKRNHGCAAPDILNIELVNDNVCATKQQERDALAAIRKMVAELGPQSCLATAFDGTFEDAENNIEDAAYSMQGRLDWSEHKLAEAQAQIKGLEVHTQRMQETINRLQQENEEAEAQQITEADLEYFLRLAEKDLLETEQRRADAVQKIVEYADNPTSDEFRQAVADHRSALNSAVEEEMRLSRLNGITQWLPGNTGKAPGG